MNIHTYTYALYTHTCANIYIRMHMHTYAQTENPYNNTSTRQANIIDAYTHLYAYACIYTHIYIYTYVHNLQRVCSQMCTLV